MSVKKHFFKVLSFCFMISVFCFILNESVYARQNMNLSLSFVVDASGSMKGQKLQAAKNSVRKTVGSLRTDLGVEMSLFAFSGCKSCKLMHGLTQNPKNIVTNLGFQASGSTPLAFSMQKSADFLRTTGNASNGIIILLSDGEETCGGNPANTAGIIKTSTKLFFPAKVQSNQMLITVVVIGFDIKPNSKAEKQLRATAQKGGGHYYPAANAGELLKVLRKVVDSSIRKSLPPSRQNDALRFEQLGESDWEKSGSGPDRKVDTNAPDYEQYQLDNDSSDDWLNQ